MSDNYEWGQDGMFQKFSEVQAEKLKAAIQTLTDNRKKIVSKSVSGEAVFFLGKTRIVIKADSVQMGDRIWKLPKEK